MLCNHDVLRLRVLVGYLGERQQANWWLSSFFDRTSEPFLAPIFGPSVTSARLVGVTEAARRIHDAAIGVGRVFHLFRLPETVEQELHRIIGTSAVTAGIESRDIALEELRALSSHDVTPKPGPVHVGGLDMLIDTAWVPLVASHYRAAFIGGIQSIPYFAG